MCGCSRASDRSRVQGVRETMDSTCRNRTVPKCNTVTETEPPSLLVQEEGWFCPESVTVLRGFRLICGSCILWLVVQTMYNWGWYVLY